MLINCPSVDDGLVSTAVLRGLFSGDSSAMVWHCGVQCLPGPRHKRCSFPSVPEAMITTLSIVYAQVKPQLPSVALRFRSIPTETLLESNVELDRRYHSASISNAPAEPTLKRAALAGLCEDVCVKSTPYMIWDYSSSLAEALKEGNALLETQVGCRTCPFFYFATSQVPRCQCLHDGWRRAAAGSHCL